jgi:redox-sensitive bicupin YhaK (pirin superfamily)
VIHEELPSERGRELHGVQIFVNLSSKNKFAAPQVLQLDRGEAPQWRSDAGDRVRVVIGSFDGVESSLVPIEPFNLLDVELRRSIAFDIPSAFNALVCVLDGGVRVHANGVQRELQRDQAIALHSTGGSVTLEALQPATLLLLSGHQIREPVVIEGNFVMNERSQIVDAVSRFRAGKMGQLAPLSDV